MTIDALSGRTRRSNRRKHEPPALAIGEEDANIVACPACARPLDAGSRRCPTCGTRIIAGVRAVKALSFATAGLLVGMIIGTSVTGAIAIVSLAEPVEAVVPVASAVPGASVAVVPSAAAPVRPTMPSAAVSALRQAADLNQRLVADGDRLAAALAVRRPSSPELARILRSLSLSAAYGDRIAPQVGAWDEAATLSTDLGVLYAAVGTTARDGLAASYSNTGAYVRASRSMLTVLGGLVALDAAAQPLAAKAGVALAPLVPTTSPAP
jgi:hypothetical protein